MEVERLGESGSADEIGGKSVGGEVILRDEGVGLSALATPPTVNAKSKAPLPFAPSETSALSKKVSLVGRSFHCFFKPSNPVCSEVLTDSKSSEYCN